MSSYESLRSKLTQNKVKVVIKELLNINTLDEEIRDTIILLSRNWKDLETDEIRGLGRSNEQKQRIVYSLLQVITQLEGKDAPENKKETLKQMEELEEKVAENYSLIEKLKEKLRHSANLDRKEYLSSQINGKKTETKKLLSRYETYLAGGIVSIGTFTLIQVMNDFSTSQNSSDNSVGYTSSPDTDNVQQDEPDDEDGSEDYL
jgi:DNA gyrase/topoisomerase IV subunit A